MFNKSADPIDSGGQKLTEIPNPFLEGLEIVKKFSKNNCNNYLFIRKNWKRTHFSLINCQQLWDWGVCYPKKLATASLACLYIKDLQYKTWFFYCTQQVITKVWIMKDKSQ